MLKNTRQFDKYAKKAVGAFLKILTLNLSLHLPALHKLLLALGCAPIWLHPVISTLPVVVAAQAPDLPPVQAW